MNYRYFIQYSQDITPSHQVAYTRLGAVRRVASDIRTMLGDDAVIGIRDLGSGRWIEIYRGEIPPAEQTIIYRKRGETVERKRKIPAWKVAQRRRLIENARSFMLDCYPRFEDQTRIMASTDQRIIKVASRAAGTLRSLVKLTTPYRTIIDQRGYVAGYARCIRTFKAMEKTK